MHAPVKFHEYIPYGLGVIPDTVYFTELSPGEKIKKKNARVVFFVYDTSSQCDACTHKVL